MAKEIQFIKGVSRLHAFYTENVRMLAHAYDLSDKEAAQVLATYDYNNVAHAILRPPQVDVFESLDGTLGDSTGE